MLREDIVTILQAHKEKDILHETRCGQDIQFDSPFLRVPQDLYSSVPLLSKTYYPGMLKDGESAHCSFLMRMAKTGCCNHAQWLIVTRHGNICDNKCIILFVYVCPTSAPTIRKQSLRQGDPGRITPTRAWTRALTTIKTMKPHSYPVFKLLMRSYRTRRLAL